MTQDPELPPSDPATYRVQLVEQLPEMEAAAAHVVDSLTNARNAYAAVRELLLAGAEVRGLLTQFDPARLRGDLAESLTELEQARHRGQCMLFRLLRAEGMTIADIARAWGISRQLASRLVNEPLDEGEVASEP